MKTKQIEIAVIEAKRFLESVKKLKENAVIPSYDKERYYSPKHTGATRRASMDLTRALADLRRRD